MGINVMIEHCLCNIIIPSDAENWNLSSAEKRLDFSIITLDPFLLECSIRPSFTLSVCISIFGFYLKIPE